jgi:hypothetical protein
MQKHANSNELHSKEQYGAPSDVNFDLRQQNSLKSALSSTIQ